MNIRIAGRFLAAALTSAALLLAAQGFAQDDAPAGGKGKKKKDAN